jgi:plasmid maintenance system killer protein
MIYNKVKLMIKSFTCKDTAKLWNGETTKRWHSSLQDRALVKLRLIDAAITINGVFASLGTMVKFIM